MENAADDPRQFAAGEPGLLDDGMGGMGDAALGPAALLCTWPCCVFHFIRLTMCTSVSLQNLMDRGMRDRAPAGGTGPSVRTIDPYE